MATLQIQNGLTAGQIYELRDDQIVLGRDQFCDIVVPVHSISRQHARILREGDCYFLEDLNSLNGTFLNGHRVSGRMRLAENDEIVLHETRLAFQLAAPTRPPLARGSHAVIPTRGARGAGDTLPGKTVVGAPPTGNPPTKDDPSQAKLRAMIEMTRSLGRSLVVDEFLAKILESVFDIFPEADWGYILLVDRSSGHFTVGASRRRDGADDASTTMGPINSAIAARVLREGEAVISTSDRPESDWILLSAATSAMTVPLTGPSRRSLGIVYVETRRSDTPFSPEDLEVLVSVATVAGQAIEHAQLHEAQLRLDRRERELSTAKEVQRHFLPQRRPDRPGYRFFDYYCAAEDVGGDYFGYIELSDGRLAIALGDVSGKGVSAALLMARLCSEVRYCLATSTTPLEAVKRLNLGLADPTIALGDRFVTFLLCVIDVREHTLSIVNAGHLPPLRRRQNGEVESLGEEAAGAPLGYDCEHIYREFTVSLDVGDLIVLFTDGVTDATNPDDESFGIRRVCERIRLGPREPERLGITMVDEVHDFLEGNPQTDDICLLCFSRER